ncbi:MAG: hypothetical protein RBR50_01145 [Candidatus Izemoplasmatales bacterium]|nr:hypothetical protein [Candidatus Izemoplasmatales bacterium]
MNRITTGDIINYFTDPKKDKYQTQLEWVKEVIAKQGYITRNQALRQYISRLGALIAKLKDEGYEFKAYSFNTMTRWGESKDYVYQVTKSPKTQTKVKQ